MSAAVACWLESFCLGLFERLWFRSSSMVSYLICFWAMCSTNSTSVRSIARVYHFVCPQSNETRSSCVAFTLRGPLRLRMADISISKQETRRQNARLPQSSDPSYIQDLSLSGIAFYVVCQEVKSLNRICNCSAVSASAQQRSGGWR